MREKRTIFWKSVSLIVTACLIVSMFVPIGTLTLAGSQQSTQKGQLATTTNKLQQLEYSFLFEEPTLQTKQYSKGTFTKVEMPGTVSIGNGPGSPTYQARPIKILLPQGTKLLNINVEPVTVTTINTAAKGIDLKQKQPILPYQPQIPIGEQQSVFYYDQAAYTTLQKVPSTSSNVIGVDYCKGYAILSFSIFPTSYIPDTGTLSYAPEIKVTLTLEQTGEINQFYRPGDQEDRDYVKTLVFNPEITDSYSIETPPSGLLGYPGGLCNPSDNGGRGYDYIILVRTALYDFTGTYTWNDLIAQKNAQGLDATKVKVEDILACSAYWKPQALFNDTPAKIREFCKDAYQDWGAKYVLVAGDQDNYNPSTRIERRFLDYSYESDCESDLYWSNLDRTFNADQDANWGEEGDAGFDLYSELYFGSIPCDTGTDVSNWLTKLFYYANNWDETYLDNAAFYGGDSTWNCQGDDFVEFGALKGTRNWLGPIPGAHGVYPSWLGYQYGFETWNATNLGIEYDLSVKWSAASNHQPGWSGGSTAAAINGLRTAINNNQCTLISALAHADPTMAMDVYNTEWESLYTNTKPFFLTDMGCHCGDMDGADDGVLHSMLFHSNTELAFACTFNTGYGWGSFDDTNSSSAMQMKCFWDYMFDTVNHSGSTANWQFGKAHAYSKDEMAPTINWTYDDAPGSWRGIIESCLFFGDPAQLVKPPLMPEHNIAVTQLTVPTYALPGQQVNIQATIINNGQHDESNVQVSFRINDVEQNHQVIPFLVHNTGQQVNYLWTVPALGFYTVTVNASIPGVIEDFYYDNEQDAMVISGPDVAVTSLSAADYAAVGRITPISGTVANLGTSNEWITVNFKVNGEIVNTQQVYLIGGSNTNVNYNWVPSVTGTYPVGLAVSIAGEEPYLGNNAMYKNVSVFIANGVVLLVIDDDGDGNEHYYQDALMANSYLYENWNRASQGTPSPSTMALYDVVIWFTGSDYSETLSTQDQNNLISYLTSGGRLFISGQDIGWSIGSSTFYRNYLHASYQVDDAGPRTVVGTAGDPIGDGLTIAISGGDGANNQAWPDGFQPISPGTTVFTFQGSSYKAAVKTDTAGYKVVYFSYSFEAISTQAHRNEVMHRVLTWLSPPRLTIEGDCFYANQDPVDTMTVEIRNLNTKRTWDATTNNNHYTLFLTPGQNVNATETLRITARDTTDCVNITDHVVTTGEITAGTIHIDLILNIHYRDLKKFPFYTATLDTGAAIAQMMLNYLWWNSTTDPNGPPMHYTDQQALFTAFNTNGGLYLDTDEMCAGLNAYRPSPHDEYGYFFAPYANTSVTPVIQQICIWLDYPVSWAYDNGWTEHIWPKPGHPNHVPIAIPTAGTYNNWMTIRGIHTTADAWNYPEFPAVTVYGFWLNDPKTDGLGANTYVTSQQFLTTYFRPIGITGDTYRNKYVALTDPLEDITIDTEKTEVTLAITPDGFSPSEARLVQITSRNMGTSDIANTIIIKTARNAVNNVLKFDTSNLMKLFSETTAIGKPIYKGSECIITFGYQKITFEVHLLTKTGALLQFSVYGV